MTTTGATVLVDEGLSLQAAGERERVPGTAGIWFFIIGDLLMFGVYFACYMVYRTRDQATFLHSQALLNQPIGAINTLILLTSSLLVALGTQAVRQRESAEARRLLGTAVAIGALFPVLKMFEWVPDIAGGLTPGVNLFWLFYYVMTGLHLVHVLVGLTVLGYVIGSLRPEAEPRIRFIETGALYWHMVDILWLVLFAVFYLMR